MTTKTATITEEDLLKSLQKLEGKTPAAQPKPDKPAVVTVEFLGKSTAQTIADKGSETLKKAIEVSEVLAEGFSVIGLHIDASLEALQKSAQHSAQRDQIFIGLFETLKKSVDTLAEKVEAFGKTPAATVRSTTTTQPGAKPGDVVQPLAKSAQPEPITEEQKALGRRRIGLALESLAKSAKDPAEKQTFINAVVKLETTKEISDDMLARANQHIQSQTKAAA